ALQAADVGKTARVVVTAKNAYGSASATSSQTAVVAGLPPANTALPAISGTARDGQTLSTSDGSWTGSPTPSLTYQWLRCDASGANCSAISGATASTYALVNAEDDSTIRSQVTGTNSYGSASARSSQTLPVAAVAKDIGAGDSHSCAVLSSGRVACWGKNDQGQLGNGTQTNSPLPVLVQGITNAIQVSAGYRHSCAVLSDHSVWCWGYNYYGQLGNHQSGNPSLIPVQVHGEGDVGFLTNVSQVDAGFGHTCALLSDQTAMCWGSNDLGELGDNKASGTLSSTPVHVSGVGGTGTLADVVQLSAGAQFACAVRSAATGGKVYCWGAGWQGRLGNGDTSDHYSPVEVNTIANAGEVKAGDSHACAVRSSDHSVWCWGYNSNGQLGDNSTSERHTPVQVHGEGDVGLLTNVDQVSVGGFHSCAVLSDHSVYCWGAGGNGELGNGSLVESHYPVPVTGIATATKLSAGASHTCALLSNQSLRCWGSNFDSQLGLGKIGHSETPISVSNITTAATQVSAGGEHGCAVLADHSVWCWGRNAYGQLGNNSTTDSSTPVQVVGASGVGFLMDADQVSAGQGHTCAHLTNNTVWCWGHNNFGQLGNNSTTDSPTPVQVKGTGGVGLLTGVSQVSAGGLHSCAVRTFDHTIQCWGYNLYGQLGNNSTSDSSTPVEVLGLKTDGPASTGDFHTCAVKSSDQTVWCWGWNQYGQLGNGTTSTDPNPIPVQVQKPGPVFLTDATGVSAGGLHTCALSSPSGFGYVYCWGRNESGELGNGKHGTDSSYAVQASGIGKATEVSAGYYHTCARLSNSSADCWGRNESGELGIGSLSDSDVPAPVSLALVSSISAGGSYYYRHTCAVSGGTLKCWGSDYYGQLGEGGIGLSSVPIGVFGLFW
ncbi:MAG: hypothetical protein ABSB96_11045, partial [Gaiellaceae bacterium]